MLINYYPRRIHAIALFGLFTLLFSTLSLSNSDLPEASESKPPGRIELID